MTEFWQRREKFTLCRITQLKQSFKRISCKDHANKYNITWSLGLNMYVLSQYGPFNKKNVIMTEKITSVMIPWPPAPGNQQICIVHAAQRSLSGTELKIVRDNQINTVAADALVPCATSPPAPMHGKSIYDPILCQLKPEYSVITRSTPWLLMPWFLV